jgi:hypothetical protein
VLLGDQRTEFSHYFIAHGHNEKNHPRPKRIFPTTREDEKGKRSRGSVNDKRRRDRDSSNYPSLNLGMGTVMPLIPPLLPGKWRFPGLSLEAVGLVV